ATNHNEIVLHFKHDQTWITCKHQEIWEIDTKMTRIFCFDQTIVFDKVVISGPGLPYVCEVYISLGRNIGLKQFVKVKIDSGEDIVPANDGNIESCYKSKIQKPLQELTFYTPSWVYYINAFRTFNLRIYPFYGIDEYQMERFSVMMELLNGSTTNIADVRDTNSQVNIPLYISEIRSIKINNATINAVNYYNLNFCEVELYGDCKQGTHGLDCDRRCNCPEQRCDSDGYCYMCEEVNGINICRKTCQQCAAPCSPSGECIECKPGFKGLHCVQCKLWRLYVVNALVTHSSEEQWFVAMVCCDECSHCSVDGSCDMLTGNCTFGCIHGYRGDVCLLECTNCAGDSSCDRFNASCNSGLCNPGFKGADCSDVCTNCAGKGECHIKTGACLSGCNPGFKGSHCSQTCEHCINGTCHPDNGTCTIGCLKGFYRHDCER
uniref:EGF-like domain-containing protein n=1 Tax=Biomphalaria glabrata TaxID=6526 RepID=A0A2C9JZL8_BIOGL